MKPAIWPWQQRERAEQVIRRLRSQPIQVDADGRMTTQSAARINEVLEPYGIKLKRDHGKLQDPRDSFESARLTTGEFNEP